MLMHVLIMLKVNTCSRVDTELPGDSGGSSGTLISLRVDILNQQELIYKMKNINSISCLYRSTNFQVKMLA